KVSVRSWKSANRSGLSEGTRVNTVTLSVSLCHTKCSKCGSIADFKMFESGLGGDFETYVGNTTGQLYRLDLRKVRYQGLQKAALLLQAEQQEGVLRPVPDQINCRICGTIFSARSVAVDGEETLEACDL